MSLTSFPNISPRPLRLRGHSPIGFTLVEILLALALSALIFTAIAATVDAVTGLEHRASQIARDDRVALLLLDRMTRELTAIDRAGDTEVLVGLDHDRRDEFRVWTLAYGAPRLITYRWDGEIFQRTDLDPMRLLAAAALPLHSVTALNVHYTGPTGRVDAWQGTDPPRSVAVEITVKDQVYGTIVPL